MKNLNTSQYGPEKGPGGAGEGVSKKNHEPIEVGKNVLPPSLHGKHTLENKRKFDMNEANMVDLKEDMALQVRKAETLDYIEGGGDGKGAAVVERIVKFKAENPNWIDHAEVDEIYPTADATKSDGDRNAAKLTSD